MSIKILQPPSDAWYIACASKNLRRKPIRVILFGKPYVIFRSQRGDTPPTALADRCPHRNVPLSGGRITDGGLECPYHGWTFDDKGICHNVPSLDGKSERSRRVSCFATKEIDGYIWVWLGSGNQEGNQKNKQEDKQRDNLENNQDENQASLAQKDTPNTALDFWPKDDSKAGKNGRCKFSRFDYEAVLDGDFVSNIENILDVPHTSYLHRGWFRSPPNPAGPGKFLEVHSQALPATGNRPAGFEARFTGESVPAGFLGRLLAGGSGELEHFDRFYLPNVAQVEYSLGRYRLMILNRLVPAEQGRLKLYTTVLYRLPLPSVLIKLVAKPAAVRVLRQDQHILKAMAQNIALHNGEAKFTSTEADVIRPGVEALLRGRKMPPGRTVRLRIG